MKTLVPLKSFSALSFGAVKITNANAPAIPEWSPQSKPESIRDLPVHLDRSDQSFREMLHQPATTLAPDAPPYPHGGLNE